MIRLLGIDASTTNSGIAVLEYNKKPWILGANLEDAKLVYTTNIITKDKEVEDRIKLQVDSILKVIKQYKPTEIAIEDVYLNKLTAMRALLMLRGALVYAIKVPVFFYQALTVRKSLVGRGNCGKGALNQFVIDLFRFSFSDDFQYIDDNLTDAIGVALTRIVNPQGYTRSVPSEIKKQKGGSTR